MKGNLACSTILWNYHHILKWAINYNNEENTLMRENNKITKKKKKIHSSSITFKALIRYAIRAIKINNEIHKINERKRRRKQTKANLKIQNNIHCSLQQPFSWEQLLSSPWIQPMNNPNNVQLFKWLIVVVFVLRFKKSRYKNK